MYNPTTRRRLPLAALRPAALLALATALFAVETRKWEQSSLGDFGAGTLKKLSLRSDGRIFLAPELRELLDASSAILWAIAEDSKGNVYAAGGGVGSGTAKLLRIDPSGRSSVAAELEGFQIQAIAVDRQDRAYAATAPDGKVYRVEGDGKPEVYFDPKAKYIWDLVFDAKGALYVATGDTGDIYRVTPDGQASVFFRTEETHVRSLAMDGKGNLIAGTEPSGLVLRITPAGEGFVIHQSAKREITTVAVGPDGSIYAAGVGDKLPAGPLPPQQEEGPVGPAAPGAAPAAGGTVIVGPQRPGAGPPPTLMPRPSVSGGSEVYSVDPDGFPRTIWSDGSEIVYAITLDAEGRPLLGTGNQGKIYRLEKNKMYTLLLDLAPTQVTALRQGRNGRLLAVTGNVGKVYQIGPELEKEGSLESDVLDARRFCYWGRLSFRGAANGGTIGFQARSGNLDRPQRNWSPWSPVELTSSGGEIKAPPARFLQYKLTLSASGGHSPEVSVVEVAYLQKNVAPVIERIAATPPNYRFPPRPLVISSPQSLNLSPLTESKTPPPPRPVPTTSPLSMQYAKGHIGARWLATDENDDALVYRVEIRGAQESEWKELEKELDDPYTSWDSTAFPDGEYRLRITVSDKRANPPQEALTSQLEGEPFLIDNTPPVVSDLTGSRSGGKIRVGWKAEDALNVIKQAEYSLNGGDWTVAKPVSGLSDSPMEEYRLEIDAPSGGEHTIAVRVTDQFDNQAVAKVVVK
ncbi:MAG: hypothetical protein KIT09_27070 [Bryobacteraceae bacterium]|nr:hypothetical protein [Bryobacteraceae bacterium]